MSLGISGAPATDSNRGPIDYKSIALPAELQGLDEYLLIFFKLIKFFFLFHYMMKYNGCAI